VWSKVIALSSSICSSWQTDNKIPCISESCILAQQRIWRQQYNGHEVTVGIAPDRKACGMKNRVAAVFVFLGRLLVGSGIT